jgi:DNA-binding transcriptional LysR family regulator
MRFDWTLMRSFLAVMDAGSLLGAARALATSQPTIGRHIAALEQELGVPLFERTGRGLVPTQAARTIVEHARDMAVGADAVARALEGAAAVVAGTVRITASETVATYLLPELVVALRAEEPGIDVEVVASNALSNLLRREADIAIRMVRPAQASLVARRLGDVEVGTYASRDYLRRRGTPRAAADLRGHDLIGLDRDETIVRGFRAAGQPIERHQFAIRTDDHVVAWQLICAGGGIGFAACYLAAREPRVQRVVPELGIAPLPMWLAVHREIRSTPRIRRAYDFLTSALPAAVRDSPPSSAAT